MPAADKPYLGWEILLTCPQFLFSNAALSKFVLLDPNGFVGNPTAVTAELANNESARPPPALR